VWASAKLFGPTPGGARAASVIAGTLAIPAVFLIVYLALLRGSAVKPFLPSLLAALITTICINQIELSQRLYAYGATPLFSAAVILAHLNVVATLRGADRPLGQLNLALLLYAIAGGTALCINPSLMLAVFVSGAVLGWMLLGEMLRSRAGHRLGLLSLAGLTALVLFFSALLNLKNPKYGFRYYTKQYYHALDLGAPWFLVRQAYDLLTYNLNLFYDSALYWPQKGNPVLLALVAVCVVGWAAAAAGRFGKMARHLAALGFFAVSVPAVFSILQIYTFGGDRRSLYLSPFIFAFTALGFYLVGSIRGLRWIGGLVGVGYLALWAISLPAFYRERRVPYTTGDLFTLWRDNGKLPIEVAGGGANAVRYALRDHPEIQVHDMPYTLPAAPYLYLSLHWPLEQDKWDVRHAGKLRAKGYKATLLAERSAKFMASWEYPTCLYFPPNGFWVYKVTE
jgi:hypothetical protein